MGYWENIKRHINLVEKEKFVELGDALIYVNSKGDYLAGKVYQRPKGGYALISDEFELTCFLKELRVMKKNSDEVWFKIFRHGWYFKKEDGVYIARYVA